MRAAFAIMIALSAPALADPKTDEARGHFKLGKAYQDQGAFERAAEEYKLAYEADPRPEMLFNIAQAYRLAKQKEQAIEYFKQYLAKQPSGAGADEARRHVVTLQKELDEEAAAKQAPPPTVLPPPAMEPNGKPALVETTTTVDHRLTPFDRGRGMRIAGISFAAAGVVALGIGVKFAFDAKSAADDITNNTDGWGTDDESTFDDGEAANRNMQIMYGVSGALLVTGVVLYYFGHKRRESQVLTYVTAQGAGVQGTF